DGALPAWAAAIAQSRQGNNTATSICSARDFESIKHLLWACVSGLNRGLNRPPVMALTLSQIGSIGNAFSAAGRGLTRARFRREHQRYGHGKRPNPGPPLRDVWKTS